MPRQVNAEAAAGEAPRLAPPPPDLMADRPGWLDLFFPKGGSAMIKEISAVAAVGLDQALPRQARVVKSKWLRDLLTFAMVFGPGLIVMEADNDAGAVPPTCRPGPSMA